MTEIQFLNAIKSTIIDGSLTDTINVFRQWQIDHYTERLKKELENGNTCAVSFLRSELFNLKKQPIHA